MPVHNKGPSATGDSETAPESTLVLGTVSSSGGFVVIINLPPPPPPPVLLLLPSSTTTNYTYNTTSKRRVRCVQNDKVLFRCWDEHLIQNIQQ